MSKKLLFAIIATICATTAFADTKTVTTQSYVDNKFQEKIPATSSDILDEDWGINKTLVATTDTAGQVEQMGVVNFWADDMDSSDLPKYSLDINGFNLMSNTIPTYATTYMDTESLRHDMYRVMQIQIPRSGRIVREYGVDDNGTYTSLVTMTTRNDPVWLRNDVKGTGLVTKTSTDGGVGERQIIETADVANYGTGTATEQQIQEISIPTMGAVMAAISNNTPSLPTGTAGNVVTYNASGQIGGSVATYNGSTTYNASTDASKIAVMSAVQRKMTCARYVQNAAETPENCLLWNVPD